MKGSTLIEILIYIALLAILMIGVFSSVYIFMSEPPTEDSSKLLKTYHE